MSESGSHARPDGDDALQFSDQPLHLTFQGQVAEILAKAEPLTEADYR